MVARHTKSGENIPKSPQNIQNDYRICQMLIKYTKWPYLYTIIFHSKAFKDILKVGFLVLKNTIWQPCFLKEKKKEDFSS
jgi:hypothetical protein